MDKTTARYIIKVFLLLPLTVMPLLDLFGMLACWLSGLKINNWKITKTWWKIIKGV